MCSSCIEEDRLLQFVEYFFLVLSTSKNQKFIEQGWVTHRNIVMKVPTLLFLFFQAFTSSFCIVRFYF